MRLIRFHQDESDDEQQDGLMPMIDLIFLLLVFFLLTTRFIDPEETLAQLLPTDNGAHKNYRMEPPEEELLITIVPAELPQQARLRTCEDIAASGYWSGPVSIRYGEQRLDLPANTADPAQLDAIIDFLHPLLAGAEQPGLARHEQAPIRIDAYSRLPWAYTCWVYDSVRAYEQGRCPPDTPLSQQRSCQFGAPVLRRLGPYGDVRELQRLACQ